MQDAAQVRRAQDQHLVEALPPDAAQAPRADGILPRRAGGRAQILDNGRYGAAAERRTAVTVAVADEIAWVVAQRGRLAPLLGDPGGGRGRGTPTCTTRRAPSATTKKAYTGRKSTSVTERQSQAQRAPT
ncbi:MAG TPA: hypothetical protein VFU72_13010 [Nitrolancea sp.]|nr:hypothetical protein [Nitrolancea sp.]